MTKLKRMIWALQYFTSESHDRGKSKAQTGSEHSLYGGFQKKGFRAFIRLLNEYFEMEGADQDKIFHRKMRSTNFLFFTAHRVLSLSIIRFPACVVVDTTDQRSLQRIVATDSYYRSTTGKLTWFWLRPTLPKLSQEQ